MKNWVFAIWILIGLVSCKNSQDTDNQKDKNLFDLSKNRHFFDKSNKIFEPYSGFDFLDSVAMVSSRQNSNDFSKFGILDSNTVAKIFQDSTEYYNNKRLQFGGYAFRYNSIIWDSSDYSAITIDRIAQECWMSHSNTFLLTYKKGKLLFIYDVASADRTMSNLSEIQTKSELIDKKNFLVESVKLRFDEEKEIGYIDTVAKLIHLDFSGNIETKPLFEASKEFNHKFYILKWKNPFTGYMNERRLYFYKDK